MRCDNKYFNDKIFSYITLKVIPIESQLNFTRMCFSILNINKLN